MATSLQQLLDGIAPETGTATPVTTLEDVTGALGHLGRALNRLAQDGFTAAGGRPERTAAQLGRVCTAVGALWPLTGGPLTDHAGAAADLIGRDRDSLGRAHRWAIAVELAAAADRCRRAARQLAPPAAVRELTGIGRLTAAVEHLAQDDPPPASATAVLDRLVPPPGPPTTDERIPAPDAVAALLAAVDRGQRDGAPTLREFRSVVITAIEASRYAAAVTAALASAEARPWAWATAAWQATGLATTHLEDGRREPPADPTGVARWASTLSHVLRAQFGPHADPAALRLRDNLAPATSDVQQVANQLPVLAGQLTAAVDRWSQTGQLYAYARDLPPMEDMPEDRVRQVVAGRRVPALGADLAPLRHATNRAGELSAALADALNRAATPAAPTQPHLTGLYHQHAHAPGAAERLLAQAQEVQRTLQATRSTPAPTFRRPVGPAPRER